MSILSPEEKITQGVSEKPVQNIEIADISQFTYPTEQPVVKLQKQFSLISAINAGIVTGNTWTALGGAIVASLGNGGMGALIYEFIAVSICYWFIAASIAELTSAIPASGGVYHWASITPGPKFGRVCGWFAGWLDFFAWVFGVAANCNMIGTMVVYAYGMFHPETTLQAWQIFIVLIIICWICCFIVMFGNKALPIINNIGSFLMLGGWFVTVIVCAVMPSKNGHNYATNKQVWQSWNNQTGYKNAEGFVFLAGMLNGAFAVGTPDCITHLAEEIPDAARNLPKVLFWQILVGFLTAFFYMISMFYSIHDLDAVFNADSYCPLGDIYLQSTGSKGGALGLLIVIILPIFCATIGCLVTSSRTLYALARDNAAPFSNQIGSISPKWKSPMWATFICGIISTCLGAIYIGSAEAFNAFVGSFVLLTTSSFFLSIFPHILTKRKNIKRGPFWLGKFGYFINIVSCVYIVVFFVIYCFPYTLPVVADEMNYTSVMTCGLALLVTIWWFIHGRKNYSGPKIVYENDASDDANDKTIVLDTEAGSISSS
ncbi:uncharacterized protein SCDLUD_002352 [Saccharomycodes ludwigii]|uniref:uncharacterized protein n=1 Tax=Saccharomycodes ludwigii TaxID=36035 RepID=UPI001E8C54E7|nr:hypothetical protein SCDLUD_002352 [Saccharomycodes ludwigii]KAH3900893.1 hypothetical protein SCDLUD_002352 [Saccharomycodes ludwigii]